MLTPGRAACHNDPLPGSPSSPSRASPGMFRPVLHRKPNAVLVIEGECARPTAFSHHDLRSVHRYYQVDDLSKVDASLKGKGVRLRALIDQVGPDFEVRHVTVQSEDGAYSVCLPLDETSRTALVVYELGGKPLARDDGGPVRFVIPFHPDKCVNVKGATRIVLSEAPGKDTRPSNREEHERLHAH